MFSYFGNRNNRMAFTPSPERYSRHDALLFAETTLTAYLDGREKAYAVRDVLNELQALFHAGATEPAQLLREALDASPDDEEKRLALVTKALDLIGRQVRADRGG